MPDETRFISYFLPRAILIILGVLLIWLSLYNFIVLEGYKTIRGGADINGVILGAFFVIFPFLEIEECRQSLGNNKKRLKEKLAGVTPIL